VHGEGVTLLERYRIIKFESEGGMSFVYKVEDGRLQKFWALKELKADVDYLDDSMEFNQFKTEARILADFSHPAFPSVVDFFLDKGKAYIVEEWIEGMTLESMVREGLPAERIREITIQILDALDYIHRKGVVYRDLKPQNIMITKDNRIKLIDFGIARFYKAGKRKDTVLAGTPGYAPPEQYGQDQTDIRTDIYSLGACLYFMAAAVHPPEEKFSIGLSEDLKQKLAPELSRAIEKAMMVRPEDRFQTIDEFRRAIDRRSRSFNKSVLLAIILGALAIALAESRVPYLYVLLLCILIYGFVWAVREIRKSS
jgi:eukaryotic-like serine/threonine-protein kinase